MKNRSFCAALLKKPVPAGTKKTHSRLLTLSGVVLLTLAAQLQATQVQASQVNSGQVLSSQVHSSQLPSAQTQAANSRQSLGHMEDQVGNFLRDHYAETGAERVEVTVGKLDRRLVLAHCDQDLTMGLNDPSNSGGSVTVQTRCEGTQAWSIYVPAQVSIFRPMAVASRQLARGDLLEHGDIHVEIVNTSQLRQGYLRTPENIIGKELQRSMNKGEAFRSTALDSPMVIKRGDEVSIEIQAGSIAVTSNGTAMGNGRIGQRIRVRNGQSERIVSAEVVSAGKVKTSI